MEDKTIGDVLVSESSPCVIASLSDIETAKKADRYADVLEIRCDFIAGRKQDIEQEVKKISEKTSSPLLATIRRESERGKWIGSEQERLDTFRKLYKYVDAIDIEENSSIRDMVLEEAKVNKLATILSYHNFLFTDKKADIKNKIESMYNVGADIMKVAYYANTSEDPVSLLNILVESRKEYGKDNPISMIAMGRKGNYTRILFPFFGSSMTYGYMLEGCKYAPGQISVKFLRKMFDKYSASIPLDDGDYDSQKTLRNLEKDLERLNSSKKNY